MLCSEYLHTFKAVTGNVHHEFAVHWTANLSLPSPSSPLSIFYLLLLLLLMYFSLQNQPVMWLDVLVGSKSFCLLWDTSPRTLTLFQTPVLPFGHSPWTVSCLLLSCLLLSCLLRDCKFYIIVFRTAPSQHVPYGVFLSGMGGAPLKFLLGSLVKVYWCGQLQLFCFWFESSVA